MRPAGSDQFFHEGPGQVWREVIGALKEHPVIGELARLPRIGENFLARRPQAVRGLLIHRGGRVE